MLCVRPLLLPLQLLPLQLLPLLLLSARTAPAHCAAAPLTYDAQDRSTGKTLRCDACPPGTFLLSSCTAEAGSVCAPCPAGSYTEVWNYVRRCLRCGVCARNQAVKKECSAVRDCQCECEQGYYHNGDSDMCVQHRDCPPGRGVLRKGTPEKDTECHICSNGTYSDISSAHHNCTAHKRCSAAGLQEVLRGSAWHDSVCANCRDLQDGAHYLREIILALLAHHKIKVKRLRRIVRALPSQDGKTLGGSSQRDLSAQIRAWVSTATAAQIRQLPAILAKARADNASEKLRHKLSSIDGALLQKCGLERL